jgi:hypothetical protein
MKAVINEKETPVKYPMLMKADSGTIVLMKEVACGVVVANPVLIPIGQYVTTWPMENFKPFTGSITLSND